MNWKALYFEHARTLWRSQGAAFFATIVDFATLLILVEIFSFYYVPAVAYGAFLGGLSNFILNRYWAFGSRGSIPKEFIRYFFVSLASLLWNVLFVWLITEYLLFPYFISKLLVAVLVGLCWNYPIQKYWVFISSMEIAKRKRL